MISIKGATITENISLKNMNTYKIDSKAKYLVEVESIDGLINTLKYLKANNIDYFILGAGSNVILGDYFKGAIIRIKGLNKITINDNIVDIEAGAMMGMLSCETVNHNLTGLEWAVNIPGTIGGSIVGNAGAYNAEIFDNLIKITILDENLEIKEILKEDIKYEYRHTSLKGSPIIVLKAQFALEKGNKEESLELMHTRQEKRLATQPLDMPSAGSVFRNPTNDHAGRLIEAAGLKGYQIGGAKVSCKHANFIVNTGTATSNDIKNLIKLVKNTIKEKYNVDLILEQEIVDWK